MWKYVNLARMMLYEKNIKKSCLLNAFNIENKPRIVIKNSKNTGKLIFTINISMWNPSLISISKIEQV